MNNIIGLNATFEQLWLLDNFRYSFPLTIGGNIEYSTETLGARWETGICPLIFLVVLFYKLFILRSFYPEDATCVFPILNIFGVGNVLDFDIAALPSFQLILLFVADIFLTAIK